MSSAPDGVNHTEMDIDQSTSTPQSFEQLLAAKADSLPPPGQAYYEARKALWLAGPPETTDAAPELPMSPTRERLHNLLTGPDAEHSDRVWSGVAKVWRGLNAGQRLRQALPLSLLVRNVRSLFCLQFIYLSFFQVKILHAAWLRDHTWPAGTAVASSDEEAAANQ